MGYQLKRASGTTPGALFLAPNSGARQPHEIRIMLVEPGERARVGWGGMIWSGETMHTMRRTRYVRYVLASAALTWAGTAMAQTIPSALTSATVAPQSGSFYASNVTVTVE